METITLQYDTHCQQLKDLIAALIKAGAVVLDRKDSELTEEQEREAFLYTSKVNAAKMFANMI